MKRETREIPVNWTIPNGYGGRWLLIGEAGTMEIEAFPPGKLKVTTMGDFTGKDESRALDWIQEIVELIRSESRGGL